MYKSKKISLVLPAYNEEESVKKAIEEFQNIKIYDEIIIVDNNSNDSTANEIKATSATYVLENEQGYGAAIRSGLSKTTGDIIVICEPDGSFVEKDTLRLCELSEKYECVFGTRTSKEYIQKGAKMGFLLRWGNIFVAYFLSILFLKDSKLFHTDVGCTYKLISRKIYNQIKNDLHVTKSELQPEIMIRCILTKCTIKEIPVIYKTRSGISKITKNLLATTILAIKMIFLIIKLRFMSLVKN